MIKVSKKFRMFGGAGHAVTFFESGMEKKPSPGLLEHVVLPPDPSKDVIVFGAKYVESRENLNRAYFSNDELVVAYPTIAGKALDVEHEVENIVGHLYSSTYVDRATNQVMDPASFAAMDPKALRDMTIDVLVGGIVYVDRFPGLEGPVSEKRYALSMECYFDTFDIMLENGVRVTLEEAELLGWSMLVESLMSQFNSKEDMDKAHTVKVVLADKSEVPMKVYKWLKGILFSGAGLVLNPACPSCHILSTTRDEEEGAKGQPAQPTCKDGCMDECEDDDDTEGCMEECMQDCDMTGTAASKGGKAKADEVLTINLTKLDRYMEQWRKSSEGKPLNHQVKDNIIGISNVDSPVVEADKESSDVTQPFSKERDPHGTDKQPSVCPNYKYEIWVMQEGGLEEQMRHWCVYGNEKCPTAGNRMYHECLRWYNREGDWIMDTRGFRDGNNPFAPEGYENDDEYSEDVSVDPASSSASYKSMKARVDSFLYQVESMQREKEIAAKKPSKKAKGDK